MSLDGLRENLKHMKEVIRELYVFTNQLEVIHNLEIGSNTVVDNKEKRLLVNAILALTKQLKIINSTTPKLVQKIGTYRTLPGQKSSQQKPIVAPQQKLVKLKYTPKKTENPVNLTISDKDKKEFLNNLNISHLSVSQLKKKYGVERKEKAFGVGKPSQYAKISNRFFRGFSNKLISKGYFDHLNNDLRKMNSPFVLSTYVSMILFTTFLTFAFSILIYVLLLFFNISINFPFLLPTDQPILIRAISNIWILLVFPLIIAGLLYLYPSSEAKNIGSKINYELPFVSIHMAAVATSGVEPTSIFKIVLKNKEYRYTNIELRKLINLVTFHGKDLVTALKRISKTSPSTKLKELLDGLATTITSGGNLHQFLDEHAESLLFDYKIDREKYTKTSETFMDIYISIAIAAPMILLMLFVIMGSTGALGNFLGLSTASLSILMILAIVGLNIAFLVFLQLKQPPI